MRATAFSLAEIAFLVCLSSADNLVSLTACNCLRLLAHVERQPNAAQQTEVNEEDVLKRHPIYEQLGDPKVSMIGTCNGSEGFIHAHSRVIGRVGHQKRIRKLMRLMTVPSLIHVAVWQELYFRWCTLTEMTIRMTVDTTADGLDSGAAPVGDKALSAEVRLCQPHSTALPLSFPMFRNDKRNGRTSHYSSLPSARRPLENHTTHLRSPTSSTR